MTNELDYHLGEDFSQPILEFDMTGSGFGSCSPAELNARIHDKDLLQYGSMRSRFESITSSPFFSMGQGLLLATAAFAGVGMVAESLHTVNAQDAGPSVAPMGDCVFYPEFNGAFQFDGGDPNNWDSFSPCLPPRVGGPQGPQGPYSPPLIDTPTPTLSKEFPEAQATVTLPPTWTVAAAATSVIYGGNCSYSTDSCNTIYQLPDTRSSQSQLVLPPPLPAYAPPANAIMPGPGNFYAPGNAPHAEASANGGNAVANGGNAIAAPIIDIRINRGFNLPPTPTTHAQPTSTQDVHPAPTQIGQIPTKEPGR